MTAFLNRCIWNATSAGLGSFVVNTAAQNGYTPANCLNPSVTDGATYHYFATSGSDHEEGDGVWTTATSTLTRVTIRNSSTGAKVNFSGVPVVTMGGPVATDTFINGITQLTGDVTAGPGPGSVAATLATTQPSVHTWSLAQTFSVAPTFTGFTQGSVLFAGSSGVLAQDNSNLFWDATNHRLGIGTASPLFNLDNRGSVSTGAYTVVTTTPYTVLSTDYFILVDNSASGIQLNLPLASTCPNRRIIAKSKVAATVAGDVRFNPAGSDTIELQSTSLFALFAAGSQAVTLVSDGVSNWWIESSNAFQYTGKINAQQFALSNNPNIYFAENHGWLLTGADATHPFQVAGTSVTNWATGGATPNGSIDISGPSNQSLFYGRNYSLTGSNAQSLIDLAGTWNTSGTVDAISLNITNTASNASSTLLKFTVSSSVKFFINRVGAINVGGTSQYNASIANFIGGSIVSWRGNNLLGFVQTNNVNDGFIGAAISTGLWANGWTTDGTTLSGKSFYWDDSGYFYTNAAGFFLRTKTTITGGSTANVPTLTAGPVTGNPTKWLPYDDNGTTRFIPSW